MSARAYIEPGKIPPAVKELLETLHSRYTLAAASNGPYEQQLHRRAVHVDDLAASERRSDFGCRVDHGLRGGMREVDHAL